MGSSGSRRRIVVDNIHGDIALTELEWKVVNTATFQRLRSLKQLGMGHLTYPNATHSRFAHSLGVLGIMAKVTRLLQDGGKQFDPEMIADLRLSALLHDVGHYPYSHLMERIDYVTLTEEALDNPSTGKKKLSTKDATYPDHETVGRHIITNQSDMLSVLGAERAKRVGELFSRTQATDQQLSKLIHSSLDMDRLDYLLRDSRAAGVPFGEIDINYILNNIRISASGKLGVEWKALAAAEHFLVARHFMYRTVYYHKTTYGFEEACRQLLRRARNANVENLAKDGDKILEICSGTELATFTDGYVDNVIRHCRQHSDKSISNLAHCITSRTPPRLLAESCGLHRQGEKYNEAFVLKKACQSKLPDLAARHNLRLDQFLLGGPKPIKIEERGSLLTREDSRKLQDEERDELIKVYRPEKPDEPSSIVDIENTVVRQLSNQGFGINRLYVVDNDTGSEARCDSMRSEIATWMA